MSSGPLVKAVIRTIEGPQLSVECLFNPKEYQIQRSNSWDPSYNSAKKAQDLNFSGSSSAKLSMQLFFDTYLADRQANSAMAKDVRVYTDVLWRMMNPDETRIDPKSKKGRPPRVMFSWGKNWLFDAVITSMEQKFIMFTPTGMPLRAMVTIEFLEAIEHKKLQQGEPSVQSALYRTMSPEIDQRGANVAVHGHGHTAI